MISFVRDEWPLVASAVAFFGLLALIVWLAIEDGRDWEQFRREHSCRKVSETRGTIHVGYVPTSKGGGLAVMSSGGKTGWLCDDGVVYER